MKLHTVTITGADESTNINDLLEISSQFPFVEWGILFSPKQMEGAFPRNPSFKWIMDHIVPLKEKGLKLSAHICGAWSKHRYAEAPFPKKLPMTPFLNQISMLSFFTPTVL